ncbi:hypothetical protein M422DRAFT_246036 [Sphaerobolus stellatus SS14]|nr:hypothetical protein M422DRAFT_246036 [Sphaerobolus stellatus SS14]
MSPNNAASFLINSLRLLHGGIFFFLSALVEWTESGLLCNEHLFDSEIIEMMRNILESLRAIVDHSVGQGDFILDHSLFSMTLEELSRKAEDLAAKLDKLKANMEIKLIDVMERGTGTATM